MILPYCTESVNTYSREEAAQVGKVTVCRLCRGKLHRHGRRQRIVRLLLEAVEHIDVLRLRCSVCKAHYTVLPSFLLSAKHYSCDAIETTLFEMHKGVPAEKTGVSHSTARRWMTWFRQTEPSLVGNLKDFLYRHSGVRVPDVPLHDPPFLKEIELLLKMLGMHSGGRLARAMLVSRLC